MISFIHCGSEGKVFKFPSGNKLADAREGGGWLYGCIATLWLKIEPLLKMTQKFVYSIFKCSLFSKSKKILLSRWLHPKFISTLKFESRAMYWVISQEQHSIKTEEFTEINSYFYRFAYEKNIFSSSPHQWVGFFWWICGQTENFWIQHRLLSACWRYKPGFCFSHYRRNKWVNSIDWSNKLSLIRQDLI